MMELEDGKVIAMFDKQNYAYVVEGEPSAQAC